MVTSLLTSTHRPPVQVIRHLDVDLKVGHHETGQSPIGVLLWARRPGFLNSSIEVGASGRNGTALGCGLLQCPFPDGPGLGHCSRSEECSSARLNSRCSAFNDGARRVVMTFHFSLAHLRVLFPRFREVSGDYFIQFLAAYHPRCVRSVAEG